MSRGKKQQEFHESLLQILYPPPPPPPPQEESEPKSFETLNDLLPEELEIEEIHEAALNEEDDEKGNVGSGKLTRAQRKRIRKKKLKESSSQRRKIIGPLLPETQDNVSDLVLENTLQSVRQNAAILPNATASSEEGEQVSCSKQNKIKQRRRSKQSGKKEAESIGNKSLDG